MKLAAIILFICIPTLTFSQFRKQRVPKDSVAYYEQQLHKLWRKSYDSVRQSKEFKTIADRIVQLRTRSNNYTGVVFFGDLVHSNFTKFNASIAQDGFGPMEPMASRFGIGISSKRGRRIIDFYFVTIGGNSESTKGDEKIKTSLSNSLQLDCGYDLLKSKWVSIYPFIGVSFRSATLTYSKPNQTNPNFTNVTNIVANDQNVRAVSESVFGYQAGLGLDVALINPNNNMTKMILFTKFGTNRGFIKDTYKIHGIDYDPGIKQGDWLISFGIKLVSKN